MKNIVTLSIISLAITVVGCSQKKETKMENETNIEVEAPAKTQTEVLDERMTNFNKKVDDDTKAKYQKGLDAVTESGVLEAALNVGDKVPNFTLKNALGEDVSLESNLANGPVVLVWYRGGWCPYCNINLHHLQQELPNIKAQGASLLALSPEVPDHSMSTSEKHELEFQVLSDVNNNVAREYGVVYKLTDDVAKKYNEKFQLNEHNGDTSNELPLAVTYIINTNGVIEYAFLDADYRKRAEPTEITAFLKSMKK